MNIKTLNKLSRRERRKRSCGALQTGAIKKLLFVVLAVSLLAVPRPARACGPFTLEAIFTFSVHPDFPLDAFARGHIGVLQPTYARSYLFAAYRHIAGAGFNPSEQQALVALWKERLENFTESDNTNWIARWTEARARVAGVGAPSEIGVYRAHEKPNDSEAYYNCHDDAFRAAAATLDERIKKYGAEHPSLKSWVAAQDDVFANCSEGQRTPAPAPPDADPLMRADRAYQIAAAHFYAARFDDARRAFDEIARDAASPYRTKGAYLSARASLRQGSLSEDAAVRSAALVAAEKGFQSVIEDRTLSASHEDARRLLSLTRLRLRPAERLRELAQATLRREAQGSLKQDVWDYTVLLDRFINDSEANEAKKFTDLPATGREDDLTDWLMTFQVTDSDARAYSLQKWMKAQTLPWLVAALSKIDGRHSAVASLLDAASKVKPDSPAFASVAFHSVRLLTEQGREADARRQLDALLAQNAATFPPSALNLMLNRRMRLARDLEEFLRFAQRTPSGFSYNDDGREIPVASSEMESDAEFKTLAGGRTFFDTDSAAHINRHLPLALLKEAAASRALPVALRREVAVAAWVRAVLLNDRTTDRELVPVVLGLAPDLKGFAEADVDGTDDARRFSALYAILKFAGAKPYVAAGVGRTTPLKELDSYRDNWWCAQPVEPAGSAGDKTTGDANQVARRAVASSPKFLSAEQVSTAARENARLASLGAAPNYLARQAVEFANKFPDDPRAPETLHLAVRSTRYGCADKATGALSKAAHALLHKRYPRSEWAKKTPYWFKGT